MNHLKTRWICLLLTISMLTNSFYYWCPIVEAKETEAVNIVKEEEPKEKEILVITTEPENIEEPVEEIVEEPTPEPIIEEPAPEPESVTNHTYIDCLTKSGGVYWNPYTGLKETWYSQRVLPGGGLDIPGRHVNEEGFVCDGDGYICLASSTYSKGTVVETSRGIGKVYDSGCAPGTIDIYTDW